MKRFAILLAAGGLFTCIFSQQIFRTNLEGMAVQTLVSTENIDGFTVSGPDAEGYVYLVAHAGTDYGEVVRTRWEGSGFQEFTLPAGEYVSGFQTSGPDAEGYVYLVALGSDGSSGAILRTKWLGSAVQEYSPPPGEEIRALNAGNPGDGYVYLSVASVDIKEEPGQGWMEPAVFGLEEMASPCFEAARISYSIATSCKVSIRIYDSSGRLITRLVNEEKPAGRYDLVWDLQDNNGKKVSAGVYFVKMDAGEFKATTKTTVVR